MRQLPAAQPLIAVNGRFRPLRATVPDPMLPDDARIGDGGFFIGNQTLPGGRRYPFRFLFISTAQ